MFVNGMGLQGKKTQSLTRGDRLLQQRIYSGTRGVQADFNLLIHAKFKWQIFTFTTFSFITYSSVVIRIR